MEQNFRKIQRISNELCNFWVVWEMEKLSKPTQQFKSHIKMTQNLHKNNQNQKELNIASNMP